MSAIPPAGSPGGDLSVDRLLRAVSPVLSLELGRVLEEQRKKLLAEANVRLRKALLDKEAELKALSHADQSRVRVETAGRVREEVTRELEVRFEKRLSTELRALKDRLGEDGRRAEMSWQQERAGLGEEAQHWRVLAEFYQRAGAATSQVEILRRFLKAAGHFAGGVALYLNKPDGLARWGMEGDQSAFPELVSDGTKDPEWYWVPITVRSRKLVVVGATGVRHREALDTLVSAFRRAIENLGLRVGTVVPDENSRSASGSSA